MDSWYSGMCPLVRYMFSRAIAGVRTRSYPAANSVSLASFSNSSMIAVPRGSHMGKPGPTSSSNMNSSNSLPSLRWARFFASSSMAKYSSIWVLFLNAVP